MKDNRDDWDRARYLGSWPIPLKEYENLCKLVGRHAGSWRRDEQEGVCAVWEDYQGDEQEG